MLNAKEAKQRTTDLINKDMKERAKGIEEFCTNVCGKAIEGAIENRKYNVSVSIPKELDVSEVAAYLRENGYCVSITHGVPTSSVLIDWTSIKS